MTKLDKVLAEQNKVVDATARALKVISGTSVPETIALKEGNGKVNIPAADTTLYRLMEQGGKLLQSVGDEIQGSVTLALLRALQLRKVDTDRLYQTVSEIVGAGSKAAEARRRKIYGALTEKGEQSLSVAQAYCVLRFGTLELKEEKIKTLITAAGRWILGQWACDQAIIAAEYQRKHGKKMPPNPQPKLYGTDKQEEGIDVWGVVGKCGEGASASAEVIDKVMDFIGSLSDKVTIQDKDTPKDVALCALVCRAYAQRIYDDAEVDE